MLQNTFCHIPGIGIRFESELWKRGICSWYDMINGTEVKLKGGKRKFFENRIHDSIIQLNNREPRYFSQGMPSNQRWRLFSEFRDDTAYLDIETTGLGGGRDHITTIALYDGKTVKHYVYGKNLEQFVDDIWHYRVVVTYNGNCFDIPFINKSFSIRLDQVHIDLRFLLSSLGYKGGLKGCEKQLGLNRDELDGVNGYFAVLLWQDYIRNNNEKALDTLLAYNVLDAVNLEPLMVAAYNLKLKDTPFALTHQLASPQAPHNPFVPDHDTINRIMVDLHRD